MIKGGRGGGRTKTGLRFEKRKDILRALSQQKGYIVQGDSVFFKGKEVALSLKKNKLYEFLDSQNVDFRKFLSKKLLPDAAIYVPASKTLFVVELKFQKVAGSVDEKLQTCDFKRKQYVKLMTPLDVKVEYIYVLSSWFKKSEYKDVRDYISSVGCHFYFGFLPLEKLRLPLS